MNRYILMIFFLCSCIDQLEPVTDLEESDIILPQPRFQGVMSVEEAIKLRRSERDFQDRSLSLEQISQLLWAGQGITMGFKRAAPSAGATYPLTVYVVVGNDTVSGLPAAVYEYVPTTHSLALVKSGDFRQRIAEACLNQTFIREAPVSIVIAAEYERTTARYGERGNRYVHMEAGHVGQNIYLQAVALELGTVVVGAFLDADLAQVVSLPEEQVPLYVMPVGYST
jgi:SagB-type dehydrogenase family enzyme